MSAVNRNTGNRNTGNHNTGDSNTGNRNTGNCNTGDRNTGYHNTGNCNTGNYNTGNYNPGNWNTGYRNPGFFCTESPSPTFFDKPTDLTWNEAYSLIPSVDLPIGTEWIESREMTPEKKKADTLHSTIGGFLRKHTLPIRKSFPQAWAKMTEEERARWTSLPNFDAEKFLTITGVDVREPDVEVHTIVLNGQTITIPKTIMQAIRAVLDTLT